MHRHPSTNTDTAQPLLPRSPLNFKKCILSPPLINILHTAQIPLHRNGPSCTPTHPKIQILPNPSSIAHTTFPKSTPSPTQPSPALHSWIYSTQPRYLFIPTSHHAHSPIPKYRYCSAPLASLTSLLQNAPTALPSQYFVNLTADLDSPPCRHSINMDDASDQISP